MKSRTPVSPSPDLRIHENLRRILVLLAASLFSVSILLSSGCERHDDPAEETIEEIDEAVEELGDSIANPGDR